MNYYKRNSIYFYNFGKVIFRNIFLIFFFIEMESKVEALVNILIDFIEEPDKTMGNKLKKQYKVMKQQ